MIAINTVTGMFNTANHIVASYSDLYVPVRGDLLPLLGYLNGVCL